jgi:hypothetical protein
MAALADGGEYIRSDTPRVLTSSARNCPETKRTELPLLIQKSTRGQPLAVSRQVAAAAEDSEVVNKSRIRHFHLRF